VLFYISQGKVAKLVFLLAFNELSLFGLENIRITFNSTKNDRIIDTKLLNFREIHTTFTFIEMR